MEWGRLPDSWRDELKRHVLDTIGVMFAGFESAESRPAREAARGWGAGSDAAIVGSGERLPAPGAAFINALHGRIHTFDDTYEPGTLHPGSTIVATALVHGNVTLAAFRDLHADTAVRDLTSRVGVLHDESLESRYPASWPHHVTVYMKNGEVHEALSEYPPGRVDPIPDNVVEAKFRDLTTPRLGEEQAARLLTEIRNVEAVDDIGEVTALTFVHRKTGGDR